MKKVARTLEEFQIFAAGFARDLRPRAEGATLITLSGELGAGKTAFVQAAAKALGVNDTVNSPTFVLEKIYKLPAPLRGAGFTRLVHIDAYRLERGAKLSALGFDELMHDSGNLIFFEWPEKVMDALPAPSVAFRLEPLPDGSRILTNT